MLSFQSEEKKLRGIEPPMQRIMILLALVLMPGSTAWSEHDIEHRSNPVLPMSQASVESLVVLAGWTYRIDAESDIQLIFAGDETLPHQVVYLIIERTPAGEPWGVSFLHPVGTIPASRGAKELENLLRLANEFNRSRLFGKVFLNPEEDGSWSVRFMHSFDFADGISAANFLDPLLLLLQEMDALHDRFFLTIQTPSSGE
jgi:hypothetical protein